VVDQQVTNSALKPVAPITVDNSTSEYEPQVAHDDVREDKNGAQDSKERKLATDQQAADIERQMKAAQLEAQRAMRVAKEQQQRLANLQAEKVREEKLAKQRLAKLEAERLAKAKAEKLARERDKKLLAQKGKEVVLAKAKVEKAKTRFQNLVKEAKKAKADYELAWRNLTEKTESYKQASMRVDSPAADRAPAQESESDELTAPAPPPAPAAAAAAAPAAPRPAPQAQAPQTSHHQVKDDLKWSDEK
jgi:colicin import membrane protein